MPAVPRSTARDATRLPPGATRASSWYSRVRRVTAPTDGVEVTHVRSLVPEAHDRKSVVDERLARDGARQALVFEDRRWTFAELARNIDAVARGLVALG